MAEVPCDRANDPAKRESRRLSTVLGLLLSVALLALLAWLVPLRETVRGLAGLSPLFALAAMGSTSASLLLRGKRWALLLGGAEKISGASASAPIMIGLALNAVIPGRIGEFVRIGLGARKFGTGLVFTTTTVVADRMLDALTLLAMLGISLLILPRLDQSTHATVMGQTLHMETLLAAIPRLALLCLALAVLFLFLLHGPSRRFCTRLLVGVPRIGRSVAEKADRLLAETARGLGGLRHPGTLVAVTILSILVWMPLALTNTLVAVGMPGVDLSFTQVLVMTSVTIAAASIPAAPGAWGTFEAAGLLAIRALGIDLSPGDALAYVVACHVCQYIPAVAIGFIAMHRESLSLASVREMTSVAAPPQSGKGTHRSGTAHD